MFEQLNQKEIIKSLSQKDLYINLYFTQGIFLFLTLLFSLVFNQGVDEWVALFHLEWGSLLIWTLPTVVIIVVLDVLLWIKVPKKWIDDGGINERIFSNISVFHLFLISIIIGVSEEILFRGVLQVNIGYVASSLLFAFMHIRYITKPVLLLFVTLLSFLLGWIFMVTGNLLIPIVIHICIDFLLGLIIRYNLFSVRKANEQ
ncbi:lysostaphin resistance A-like protein [Pseudalkalibacillus sp. Hm43]|uniref:CPBP family intramembrane glutamic endopeptidase n=1 Tax=Pseudalkalibacillus sp. Hm43 TaxID=3450742 RepID=UPI003F42816B